MEVDGPPPGDPKPSTAAELRGLLSGARTIPPGEKTDQLGGGTISESFFGITVNKRIVDDRKSIKEKKIYSFQQVSKTLSLIAAAHPSVDIFTVNGDRLIHGVSGAFFNSQEELEAASFKEVHSSMEYHEGYTFKLSAVVGIERLKAISKVFRENIPTGISVGPTIYASALCAKVGIVFLVNPHLNRIDLASQYKSALEKVDLNSIGRTELEKARAVLPFTGQVPHFIVGKTSISYRPKSGPSQRTEILQILCAPQHRIYMGHICLLGETTHNSFGNGVFHIAQEGDRSWKYIQACESHRVATNRSNYNEIIVDNCPPESLDVIFEGGRSLRQHLLANVADVVTAHYRDDNAIVLGLGNRAKTSVLGYMRSIVPKLWTKLCNLSGSFVAFTPAVRNGKSIEETRARHDQAKASRQTPAWKNIRVPGLNPKSPDTKVPESPSKKTESHKTKQPKNDTTEEEFPPLQSTANDKTSQKSSKSKKNKNKNKSQNSDDTVQSLEGISIHPSASTLPGKKQHQLSRNDFPDGSYELYAEGREPTEEEVKAMEKMVQSNLVKQAMSNGRRRSNHNMYQQSLDPTEAELKNTPNNEKGFVQMDVDENRRMNESRQAPPALSPGKATRDKFPGVTWRSKIASSLPKNDSNLDIAAWMEKVELKLGQLEQGTAEPSQDIEELQETVDHMDEELMKAKSKIGELQGKCYELESTLKETRTTIGRQRADILSCVLNNCLLDQAMGAIDLILQENTDYSLEKILGPNRADMFDDHQFLPLYTMTDLLHLTSLEDDGTLSHDDICDIASNPKKLEKFINDSHKSGTIEMGGPIFPRRKQTKRPVDKNPEPSESDSTTDMQVDTNPSSLQKAIETAKPTTAVAQKQKRATISEEYAVPTSLIPPQVNETIKKPSKKAANLVHHEITLAEATKETSVPATKTTSQKVTPTKTPGLIPPTTPMTDPIDLCSQEDAAPCDMETTKTDDDAQSPDQQPATPVHSPKEVIDLTDWRPRKKLHQRKYKKKKEEKTPRQKKAKQATTKEVKTIDLTTNPKILAPNGRLKSRDSRSQTDTDNVFVGSPKMTQLLLAFPPTANHSASPLWLKKPDSTLITPKKDDLTDALKKSLEDKCIEMSTDERLEVLRATPPSQRSSPAPEDEFDLWMKEEETKGQSTSSSTFQKGPSTNNPGALEDRPSTLSTKEENNDRKPNADSPQTVLDANTSKESTTQQIKDIELELGLRSQSSDEDSLLGEAWDHGDSDTFQRKIDASSKLEDFLLPSQQEKDKNETSADSDSTTDSEPSFTNTSIQVPDTSNTQAVGEQQ